MKQSEILKVLAVEIGSSDLDQVNKALKTKDFVTKFRITGPTLVHFGFTGLIKSLTEDGVKIYNVNKVNLIRYDDIKTFAKAIPREERKPSPKPAGDLKKNKPSKKFEDEDDEEDYDNDDDFDENLDADDDIIENESVNTKLMVKGKKKPKKSTLHIPGSGSRFIPKKK